MLLSCAKEHKEGLLWKISGNGLNAPSYLFGTGHGRGFYLGCSILDSVPGFYESLKNTNQYIGEYNYYEPDTLNTEMLPADSTYDKFFNKEDLALLDSILLVVVGQTSKKYIRKPEVLLERIKGYLYYEYKKKEKTNKDIITYLPMDYCLEELAYHRGYKIVGLDNLIRFNYYAHLPEGSVKNVTDSLIVMLRNRTFEKEFKESESDTLSTRLFDAYCRQDFNEFEKYFNQRNKKYDKEYEERLRKDPKSKHVLHEISTVRNHKWMEYIPDLINKKASFIAVGLGHLLGEDGLISLLRKEGYKVEPVN